MIKLFNDKGDWPEDFKHENGAYGCECMDCGELFTGHKSRVQCKACAQKHKDGKDLSQREQEERILKAIDGLLEALRELIY